MLEKDSKVYAKGARAVYDALVAHYEEWAPQIRGRLKLGAFFFYYLPSYGEEKQPGWVSGPDVLTSISRPNSKPQVTKIPQIRAHFCFDFVANNILRMRRLSCHCDSCLKRDWTACSERQKNPWNGKGWRQHANWVNTSRLRPKRMPKASPFGWRRRVRPAALGNTAAALRRRTRHLQERRFVSSMTRAPQNFRMSNKF